MQDLEFRTGPRQLRNLRNFLIISAAAAAVFAFTAVLDRGGPAETMAVTMGSLALIGIWAYVMYALAFTVCGPAGIRTLGVFGRRRCSWPEVADIAIRYGARGGTRTVRVKTTGGRRFMLGSPVDGGFMGDPEFEDKYRQIQAYWHSAAPVTSARPGRDKPRRRQDPW